MRRELETAKQVRRSLEIVCARLEDPTSQSLDATAGELSAAIRSLSELDGRLKSASSESIRVPALAHEISAIRRELSRAQALVAAAGKFFEGWARLMAAEETGSNYTPQGVPGPVLAADRGKVVLHG